MDNTIYYAIGDVHGELERLKRLVATIEDYHRLHFPGHPRTLIQLGDMIDRGPDSAGVIDYMQTLQLVEGDRVVVLKGNHEDMMLEALERRGETGGQDFWFHNGGEATLASYRRAGYQTPPAAHRSWLARLPLLFRVPERGLVFVHAGVDPARYPGEPSEVYLWTRSPDFLKADGWTNPDLVGVTVVHGHTPTNDFHPQVGAGGGRINVDTGAVYGGPLTAAVLIPDEAPRFLTD